MSRQFFLSTLFLASPILPLQAIYAAPPVATESADTPELGLRGSHAVGTRYLDVALPARERIAAAGSALMPRSVGLRLWYPAKSVGPKAVVYQHELSRVDGTKTLIVDRGGAFENALPQGEAAPLVLVSHGFGGWSEQLSRLGEHLASRGYVVASIDHRDMAFTSVSTFLISFGNVLADRSLDQKQVLVKLLDPVFARSVPGLAEIDVNAIAVVGYSMGGYGALATSGAAYDPAGAPFKNLPEGSRRIATQADPAIAGRIKSVVLFAPWGAQPDNRAWNEASFAGFSKPMLLVDGNQDDIVNFKAGVGWLFDAAKHSDRYLLVYREAQHNVVGNAFDLPPDANFDVLDFTSEPVWRQDRINQVNQHFVTAFLDMTLKGEAAKRHYLDTPTVLASDGQWPMAFGQRYDGTFAGDAQPGYWRGFKRRTAVGLEMHARKTEK